MTAPSHTIVFLDAASMAKPLEFPDTVTYRPYSSTQPGEVAERIRDAQVVIVNKVRIDSAAMDAAPQLRLICVAAAGTDNVDIAAATARGIAVRNAPDYGSYSVAEHVIATMFALRRHLPTYQQAALDGRWSSSEHFCWHGPVIGDVGGSVMGIVGRGRIGEATATLARGLGMTVRFATTPGHDLASDELALDDLLAQADVVSLHIPLTEQTRGLIGAKRLRLMKPTAILVNTARGALVEAGALLDALGGNRLGGAAIDVLDVEPPPTTHPLLRERLPNLLVTPHVAWASASAQARLAGMVQQAVLSMGSESV